MNNEHALRQMLTKYNEPRQFALGGVSSARRPVQAGANEYSPEELKVLLARLSNMGVGRDELIAHITADEARLLKARGGSGKRNPRTGLLSFDDGDGDSGSDMGGNGANEGGGGYSDGSGDSGGSGGGSGGGGGYGGSEGYGGGGMDWGAFNDSYNANSLSDMFGDPSNYAGYNESMDDEDEDPDLAALNAIEAEGKFDARVPGVTSEKSALELAIEAGTINDPGRAATTDKGSFDWSGFLDSYLSSNLNSSFGNINSYDQGVQYGPGAYGAQTNVASSSPYGVMSTWSNSNPNGTLAALNDELNSRGMTLADLAGLQQYGPGSNPALADMSRDYNTLLAEGKAGPNMMNTGNTGNINTGNTGNINTGNTGNINTGNTGNINTGNTGNINTGDINTGNAGVVYGANTNIGGQVGNSAVDSNGGNDDYRRARYIDATGVAPESDPEQYAEWYRRQDTNMNDYARGGSTNEGLRRLYRKYARGGSV